MEDKPAEVPAASPAAPEAAAETAPAAAETAAPAEGAAATEENKAEKPPRDPEAAAKRKAERIEKRKEQRKVAREAAKERRAAGEPPKPKAPKPEKAAKAGDVETPEGAAPKITVARIPAAFTSAELTQLFAPHGTVLRAEVSKRKGRPSIGTVYYNTIGDVRRAVAALHGKHKVAGESEAISIQYAKDAVEWGEFVKKSTDEVADTLKEWKYKPSVLRSKDAKDFLNRVFFTRRNAPPKDVTSAALLVHTGTATAQELVDAKLIDSAAKVQQLANDNKTPPKVEAVKGARGAAAAAPAEKAKPSLERTFDAVVPKLDKLEKERWNRMAKANLRLNERHRFRFVDILATPSLELWRWMVEDCELTPAETGTCFAILQAHYGFTK